VYGPWIDRRDRIGQIPTHQLPPSVTGSIVMGSKGLWAGRADARIVPTASGIREGANGILAPNAETDRPDAGYAGFKRLSQQPARRRKMLESACGSVACRRETRRVFPQLQAVIADIIIMTWLKAGSRSTGELA
jgi:hypothetical protein